jgi:D-alanine-D-alanine ligase
VADRGRFKSARVGVFLGGESSEREVSLRTGGAAVEALRRKGYDVVAIDIAGDWLGAIRDSGVGVALIALHGRFGEDGCIQGALELARIPYTGSGVTASSLSMSKALAKRVVAAAGVPVAPDALYDGKSLEGAALPPFGLPLVVKPEREGSSVGVRVVRTLDEWPGALAEAAKFDCRVLVEAYVAGREITVGVINGRVLPAIEVRPKSGVYDYHSKYTAGETEYVIPVPMAQDILDRAAAFTRSAAEALGLRGPARIDYRVDASGRLFFLEANTIPGMTATSLLPKAARFDGLEFDDLVEEILDDAGLDR